MSSIVIAGDTSGTITLSAPAVAGSNTISLPAVTGTILTTAYTGAVTFDGDFTVDTNTLHVDSTNNRVGIGKTNPTTALDVVGTVTATEFAGALTGNVTGDVSGNAGTVTNGVYTTDIGSTVQAYDADLTTLAGLSSADGNFIVGSATGWVVESGATVRTSLGLGTAATTASTDYATAAQGTTADSALQPGDIGSTVQAYDADLTTLAGLSSADGNFIVGSATGWVVESGATARTSLGLGTAATTASTDYATAAQGALADSALQSADIGSTVQAYDADTAKLDTTQTWTATQTYGDNVYQQFGSSGDLLIYHNGSDSYIRENGTGSLVIGATDTLYIRNSANTITAATFTPATSVTLRYNGSTKLATSNTGVAVTGTLTATDVTIGGSSVVVDTDIGSTVQAYDADTTKNDVANTFTANQTINANLIVDTNTLYVDATGNRVGIGNAATDISGTALDQLIVGAGSGNQGMVIDSGAGGVSRYGFSEAGAIKGGIAYDGTGNTIDFYIEGITTPVADISSSGTVTATAFVGDGSGLTGISAGGGFSNMDIITASGTWTNPGSVTKVKVTVVGGGGAGASAYGAPGGVSNGGGGGAGGHAIEYITIPTSPVPVTIGAGGTTAPYPYPSPWVGTPGSTSSFGAYCSATGGIRGTNSTPGTTEGIGGDGGTGSGGLLNFTGRPGHPGYTGVGPTPAGLTNMGAGGVSIFGGYSTPNSNQGLNGNKNGPAYLYNGSPGGLYGNGGKCNGSPRPTAGSYPTAGAPGVILVEY